MPNMVLQLVNISGGEVMLAAHTSKPPTDVEWDGYLALLRGRDVEKMRSLVFTDGGAPNTAQRGQLNDALKGKTSIGAVVSSSALVRGVVTALRWFNPKIKAFAPTDTAQALTYLSIKSPRDIAIIRTSMADLRVALGDDSFRSIAKPSAADANL
jgi:hypothetical protein